MMYSRFLLGSLVFVGTFSWLPFMDLQILSAMKYGVFLLCVLVGFKFDYKLSYITFIYFIFFLCLLVVSLYHGNFDSLLPVVAAWMILLVADKIPADDLIVDCSKFLLLAAVIHSLYIIYSRVAGVNFAPASVVGSYVNLPFSPMGFANAHTLMSPILGTSVIVSIFLFKKGCISIPLFSVVNLITLPALFLTGGEAGWLALLTTFLYSVLSRFMRPWLIILAALFLLAGFGYFYQASIEDILSYSSLVERIVSIKSGVRMFMDYPIMGIGPGNSYLEFNNYITLDERSRIFSNRLVPHNVPIYLLAENGILFFPIAIVLLFVVICTFRLHRYELGSSESVSIQISMFYLIVAMAEPWPFFNNIFSSVLLYVALSIVARRVWRLAL